jgi:hypothetical protein
MRWAGHVACIEREEECVHGFGETKRRDKYDDLDMGERRILKLILEK